MVQLQTHIREATSPYGVIEFLLVNRLRHGLVSPALAALLTTFLRCLNLQRKEAV